MSGFGCQASKVLNPADRHLKPPMKLHEIQGHFREVPHAVTEYRLRRRTRPRPRPSSPFKILISSTSTRTRTKKIKFYHMRFRKAEVYFTIRLATLTANGGADT